MYWQNILKIYTRHLGEFDGKDYDKEYFDGDVKYHLGLTADKITSTGNKHQFST
jgi:2-oxoglutarate dehydrogenase complex dehydrogenase (E1) component-like enzyme